MTCEVEFKDEGMELPLWNLRLPPKVQDDGFSPLDVVEALGESYTKDIFMNVFNGE